MIYMQPTYKEDIMGDDKYWEFPVTNPTPNNDNNVLREDKIGSIEGHAI